MANEGKLHQLVLGATRWGMLLLLIGGVLFHGGTNERSLVWLEAMAWLIPGLHLVGKWKAGEIWGIDRRGLGIAGGLLLIGWLAAAFPHSVYDREMRAFLPLDHAVQWPWGSLDGEQSKSTMFRLTGLVGSLMVLSDMARLLMWRRRLINVIVCVGIGTAIFGLAQRTQGDVFGYWNVEIFPHNVFGPFWYHGNAGAFLNLCWPLVGVWLLRWSRNFARGELKSQLMFAWVVLAILAILTSVWVNIARAAHAVFILEGLVLTCMAGWYALSHGQMRRTLIKTGLWCGVICLVLAGLVFVGLWPSAERWQEFFREGAFRKNPRWQAVGVMLNWLPEVSWRGYGPGTFAAVFVVNASGLSDAPHGYWAFAHNDHLQTMLEWGWLGYLGWLSLGLLMLKKTFDLMCEARVLGHWINFAERAAIFSALCGIGLHALVDFPLQIFSLQLYTAALAALGISRAESDAVRRA